MADANSTQAPRAQKKWSSETTNFFQYRLYEIKAILSVLISNIGEYEKDNGRASDEATFLAIQQVAQTVLEIERLSYDLDLNDGAGVGNLSLPLMWARSLLEILEGMIHSEGWEIRFSDDVLSSYLATVERRVIQAQAEVEKIHTFYFRKVA